MLKLEIRVSPYHHYKFFPLYMINVLNINRVLINHHEKTNTNRKVDQEWKKEKWKTLMTNPNFTNDKKSTSTQVEYFPIRLATLKHILPFTGRAGKGVILHTTSGNIY